MNLFVRECNKPAGLLRKPTLEETDAYRSIRTNLITRLSESGGKSVLMLSAGDNAAGLTSAYNLALVTASLGVRVLLADCDLRGGLLAQALEANGKPGLTEFLTGKAEFSEVLRAAAPNLTAAVSGGYSSEGAELLHGPRFAEFLSSAREAYDYIFLHAAPVSESPDALSLADKCDGGVIVAQRLKTRHPDLTELVERLTGLHAAVLGFIVTD